MTNAIYRWRLGFIIVLVFILHYIQFTLSQKTTEADIYCASTMCQTAECYTRVLSCNARSRPLRQMLSRGENRLFGITNSLMVPTATGWGARQPACRDHTRDPLKGVSITTRQVLSLAPTTCVFLVLWGLRGFQFLLFISPCSW